MCEKEKMTKNAKVHEMIRRGNIAYATTISMDKGHVRSNYLSLNEYSTLFVICGKLFSWG